MTAWMLVKLLTGVFDPPPETLAIPSLYLALVFVLLVASIVAAVLLAGAKSRGGTIELLRDF
jgi:putative ABC transport system permease protein